MKQREFRDQIRVLAAKMPLGELRNLLLESLSIPSNDIFLFWEFVSHALDRILESALTPSLEVYRIAADLRDQIDVIEADDEPAPEESALHQQVGGDHYRDLAMQPIEYIHRNGLGYVEGAVVKYVTRWRRKGGVEDLEKARHMLDLLIEMESGE